MHRAPSLLFPCYRRATSLFRARASLFCAPVIRRSERRDKQTIQLINKDIYRAAHPVAPQKNKTFPVIFPVTAPEQGKPPLRRRAIELARPLAYSHPMTDAAIAIDNLCKTYAGGKRALDGVSFEVPRGSVFGLLGPNGAGKSTLINILAGLVNKTSGTASIWGFDIDAHPRNAKASIGIVNQEILFDPFFTPFETLEIQAGLYGVPRAQRRSMELLRAVHLEDKANAYARTLSGGMKRRLMVAKAMVHRPPVLVLDEPTAGVDIELRRQLWDYVRSLNAQGVTVVLTTHYLEEAEELCDRIAIINHGTVIANKPTRELVGMAQEKLVEVTVDRDVAAAPEAACFQKIALKGERVLEITYRKDQANAGQVLAAVQAGGFGIVEVSTKEPDLEDVFLNLTRAANA
jgi:ABC-2 type transport system ATP-binding protein